jgi:hypothetical protein
MTDPWDRDDVLDAALRELARARSRGLTAHPSAEELADYLLGALAHEEEERIQEHLALCPECAGLALDLAALAAPSAVGAGLPEDDRRRQWEEIARRLGPGGWRSAVPGRRPRGGRLLLAASLLVGLGLGVLGDRLFRRADERPRADVALVDLAPVSAGVRRSAEAPRTLRVPARAGRLALLLNLGDLRRFRRYEMDLVAPGGRLAWQEGDALRSEEGTLVLELPARALARPGLYRIRVRGRQGAAPAVPLADYAFDVLPSR